MRSLRVWLHFNVWRGIIMRGIYENSLLIGSLLGFAAVVQAQTPDTPPAGQPPATTTTTPATPAPVDPGPLHQWGTDFSFMFDGYADVNFNHPDPAFNGLRAFDVRSDTSHLNMAMITIDHAPAPVGFHLAVGFGETF